MTQSELAAMPPIETLVKEWLRLDRDQTTRSEIGHLTASSNEDELESRLRKRIAFGTAGLRARMEAGFSRMNSLTIIQTSQGLAEYTLSQLPGAAQRGLVVGHDARHNSHRFAQLTASAFANKGFRIYWLGQVHTPMVPFSVLQYHAAVGVMITASHNPAADNGYKVYWASGAQILSPRDRDIAHLIEQNLEPLVWDTEYFRTSKLLVTEGTQVVAQPYMQAIARESHLLRDKRYPELSLTDSGIKFTYTPMHGVGLGTVQAVLRHVEVPAEDFHIVQSQAQPDPTFPTVRFPNPEEKGALDEAIKVADSFGDTLIFANDPDADRFAVAEKVNGSWRQFTGNQVGVLLAKFVMDCDKEIHCQESVVPESQSQPLNSVMSTTAVSSRMLFAMTEGKYLPVETLTGFKWLGNKAQEGELAGRTTVFAYEEALGYMFPSIVYDKDGVAALAVFLGACRMFRRQGLTPWQKLQSLYAQHGYFEETNTYLISPSADVTNAVFDKVRNTRPERVGKRRIDRWRDLTVGVDTGMPDGNPNLPIDSSVQMITCELGDGVVFTARGSGTEPKIKLYIEARASNARTARILAESVLHDLVSEWFEPEANGLRLA